MELALNEFDLIEKFFVPLAGPEGLGLKDDAAHFSPPPGFDLIVTKDAMVEGVHFPDGEYGAQIAERLLRVNLSDLAAKGASPRGYLLSLAWPRHLPVYSIEAFAKGLKSIQKKFALSLWGGDTVATPGPLVISATLIGVCPEGMACKRFGAKPDDDIWVTGHIGKGFVGLSSLSHPKGPQRPRDYFYKPAPRLELQRILRAWANASIDVSDGFVADLDHLAKASHLAMSVEVSDHLWPSEISEKSLALPETVPSLLTHGDDYEILFTAHADQRALIHEACETFLFPVTRIGKCHLGEGVSVTYKGKKLKFEQTGYSHFKS